MAVLPFANFNGDPEQEFFADGITEDIISRLAGWRAFSVIARSSTFTYKGKTVDIKKVGEELGVRYVLEGSVRKSGRRVRVTAQLIEVDTSHHVMAERYDRDLTDLFELQDEITHAIAGAIEPELLKFERDRIVEGPPRSEDAYELKSAATDAGPSRSLVAPDDRPISRRMARTGDKRSSNKEAGHRGEISPQRRPAPTQKPKERPTSKGRVHKGRTRT